MSKKCTALWPEAHFQVKMYKAHHSQTTFGSSDVEKVRAVVATDGVRTLLEVLMSKKYMSLWREAHFQVKMNKAHHVSTLLEEMLKKWTPLWREAHFQVQRYKTTSDHFWKLRCRKSVAVVVRSTLPSPNVKHHMCGPLLTVQMWFCVAGARDCEPYRK